jgi:uncharacterized protein
MARRAPIGRGDVALVTGASAGIGRAFADRLAARGMDLVLVARSADRLEELAETLRTRDGVAVEVLAADLTDAAQLATVEARLHATTAPVSLLVNNAGFANTGDYTTIPVDDEERVLRLNVVAVARLAHAALGGMRARRKGGVVNVSSLGGFAPFGGMATYTASKAFVTALSQALSQEVRRDGITVLALCPGYTHTEFQERTGYHGSRTPERLWMSADQVVDVALRAFDRGRSISVPGAANRTAAVLTRMAPLPVVTRIAGLVGREA